jgi:hypothetical protein
MKLHYRSMHRCPWFPAASAPSQFHAPLPMVPRGPLFLVVHVSGSSISGCSCLSSLMHSCSRVQTEEKMHSYVCGVDLPRMAAPLFLQKERLGLPHMGWGINLGEQDRHSWLFLCSFKRSVVVGIDVPLLHYRSQLLCSFRRGDKRRHEQDHSANKCHVGAILAGNRARTRELYHV